MKLSIAISLSIISVLLFNSCMGAPIDNQDNYYEYDEYDDYVYQIDSCGGEDYSVDAKNETGSVNGTNVNGGKFENSQS